jgi:hypothetical protein
VLLRWLRTALAYSEAVAVAIDATTSFTLLNDVKALVATHLPSEESRIHLVPVAPYGFYIPALMALLHYAKNLGYERICYQSQEVHCTHTQFMAVWDAFDAETDLVVGPELQGHAFRGVEDVWEGKQEQEDTLTHTYNVNGVTVPWDTFAIWSVAKLLRVGLLPLAEAHIENGGAIEEVTAIVMQHRLFGEANQRVKLVRLLGNPIGWDHITGAHVDEARRAANLVKIQTKRQRSLAQIKKLNLLESVCAFSFVRHVQVECPREHGEEESTHCLCAGCKVERTSTTIH